MYLAYAFILSILLLILIMLWLEENRLRNDITLGLARKYWVLREKRKYVRFDEEIKIRYDLLQKPPNSYDSKTANVSQKGLCLVTYEKLKENSCIGLEVEVPGFSKPAKLIGQVAWTKDLQNQDAQGRRLFYAGVKFIKINPAAEAMLLTHLNTLIRP
ncbi:MAG: PilZ domain-containing protein [Candidatus Omnitrophica bacterium]|nr:PilZ domain-containing protein [Candidatus Omnitrophota bacterium]